MRKATLTIVAVLVLALGTTNAMAGHGHHGNGHHGHHGPQYHGHGHHGPRIYPPAVVVVPPRPIPAPYYVGYGYDYGCGYRGDIARGIGMIIGAAIDNSHRPPYHHRW